MESIEMKEYTRRASDTRTSKPHFTFCICSMLTHTNTNSANSANRVACLCSLPPVVPSASLRGLAEGAYVLTRLLHTGPQSGVTSSRII